VLQGLVSGVAWAAQRDGFELRGRSGSLGRLPRVVDSSGAYVSPARLAVLLDGSWTVKSDRGTLTVGKRSAQFVKSQRRVVVAGQTVTLDAVARINGGSWLISEDFLTRGLPQLAPGVTTVGTTSESKPAPVRTGTSEPKLAPVRTARTDVGLTELRFRSYPSFTRIVVETGAAVPYAVVSSQNEIRVRLPR